MRLAPIILFLSLCGGTGLLAQEVPAAPRPSGVAVPSFLPLVGDPAFSMRTATADLLTLHHGITRLEDRALGTHWFPERSVAGKAGGVAARFAKLAVLDVPVDYFTVVAAHEYAGHGARYRELGISGVHYAFDAPPPYGAGGGEASISGADVSVDELVAIWSGGVESHPLLQQGLALRWLENREVDYREAFLYFWATQIAMSYIQDTDGQLTPNGPDNDIQAYVRYLNFGWDRPPSPVPSRMSVADLKSKSKLGIANPFAFYSIYVGLVTYLWQGKESAPLPMLRIGPGDYLPLLRTGWTPFGLEYHMENYLRIGARTALVDLRLGDDAFHRSWGGIGIDVHRMVDRERLRVDGGVKLWKQPELTSGFATPKSLGGGVGGALSLRAYRAISEGAQPIRAVGEIGYKTAGFVEGYPMRAGAMVMFGLALRQPASARE